MPGMLCSHQLKSLVLTGSKPPVICPGEGVLHGAVILLVWDLAVTPEEDSWHGMVYPPHPTHTHPHATELVCLTLVPLTSYCTAMVF